jgi:DNA-binding GntR family transcriptional regulator
MIKATKNKKQTVYESLKKQILLNNLKPGEALNEQYLAREMKTSKTPVREALQMLAKEGLVENVPGRGSFVASLSFQDIRELTEIRELLEGEIIRRVALRGDFDLREAQEIKRKFAASRGCELKSTKSYITAGDQIHQFVFASYGNNRLSAYYKLLQEQIVRIRHFLYNRVDESRARDSYEEHLEIIDALMAKDPKRAEAAIRKHLQNALEYLKAIT